MLRLATLEFFGSPFSPSYPLRTLAKQAASGFLDCVGKLDLCVVGADLKRLADLGPRIAPESADHYDPRLRVQTS